MTILQFTISLIPIALINGYFLRLTRATLLLGRSLSDTESPTGFQDAVTPPWSTNITLFGYLLSVAGIGFGFYQYGWAGGGSAILCLLFGTFLFTSIMPKPDSAHFQRLIVHSMINRHADYLKSNDQVRAVAMAQLIEKLGIPMSDQPPQKTSLPAEKDATLSVVQHQNEAEQGHDMAQFRPEACNVQGEGVPKDNVQAVTDMISKDTAMRIIDGFFVYYQNKNRPDFIDENDIGIKLDTFWRCLKIYRDFLVETKSKKLEIFFSLTDGLGGELVKEIDPLDKVFLHQRDSNTQNYFILYVKYTKISKEDNSSYIEKYGF